MNSISFLSLLWIIAILNSVMAEEILSISIPESYSPIGENQDKPKVNPKLDLENSDEEISTTPHSTSRYPKIGNTGTNSNQGKPSSPKIQGVRVTVDTGPNGKDGSGSKESVEILEPKKGKRVGIHTDITFEISDDSDTGNTTMHKEGDDEEEVPVFKGRDSTTNRPRRPYDPKTDHHWAHEPPQRHHSSGPSYRQDVGGGGDHRDVYYPNYPQTNDQEYYRGGGGGSIPGISAFHSDSLTGSGIGTSNRRDGWTGYIPMTNIWTTERSYYSGGYKAYDNTRWKPCYCIPTDDRSRRESRIGYLKIDDKLDLRYSSKKH